MQYEMMKVFDVHDMPEDIQDMIHKHFDFDEYTEWYYYAKEDRKYYVELTAFLLANGMEKDETVLLYY
jgi:hypothetical protein